MESNELTDIMRHLGVSKREMAELLAVTTRALNLWCAGSNRIPGPVAAYLRLLRSLPAGIVVRELERLAGRMPVAYDGQYFVHFRGHAGQGIVVLTFMSGKVFGHDGGVAYDGSYEPSLRRRGYMDIHLTLAVPAGVALVQGVPEQPNRYTCDVAVTVAARGSGSLTIPTPLGAVEAELGFLRPLPTGLAA